MAILIKCDNKNISVTCYFYCVYQAIGLMSRVFANSPGDLGSIPG